MSTPPSSALPSDADADAAADAADAAASDTDAAASPLTPAADAAAYHWGDGGHPVV